MSYFRKKKAESVPAIGRKKMKRKKERMQERYAMPIELKQRN